MKKVKIHKKWKINRTKIKNFKNKYLIILILSLYIIIFIIIIKSFLIHNKDIESEEKIELYNIFPTSNVMYYRGEMVLKSKVINDSLANVSDRYKKDKNLERFLFKKYYYLPEYPDDPVIQGEIRQKFLEKISKIRKKTINKIDIIFLERTNPFGNNIPSVNNAIFYCEVLGCNEVRLKDHHTSRRWLLSNPVYIPKLNITIKKGPNVNCEDDNIMCIYRYWDILYPFILIPQIRIQYLKDEILKNLPSVNVDPDSIYIHIRGKDIFSYFPLRTYTQPPLCFYERIINKNNFKNIYIVSADKKNVVVDPLIKKYSNVVFQKHNFEYDISLLAHAFNVALSVSSFCISAIKFNDNLKNLYEFAQYRLSEMILHLHYNVYKMKMNFTIHSMRPSDEYASYMFAWRKSANQKKFMLESNCTYDFVIRKPL